MARLGLGLDHDRATIAISDSAIAELRGFGDKELAERLQDARLKARDETRRDEAALSRLRAAEKDRDDLDMDALRARAKDYGSAGVTTATYAIAEDVDVSPAAMVAAAEDLQVAQKLYRRAKKEAGL